MQHTQCRRTAAALPTKSDAGQRNPRPAVVAKIPEEAADDDANAEETQKWPKRPMRSSSKHER